MKEIIELVEEIENVSWDIGYDYGFDKRCNQEERRITREEHIQLVKKLIDLNLKLRIKLSELEEKENE